MSRNIFNDPELLMNTLLDLLAEQEGKEITEREIFTHKPQKVTDKSA